MEGELKKKGRATAIDQHVGSQLKKRRIEVGLSQEALGEKADVTFQQIQKYENGSNRVSSGKLFEFAEILDCPIDYFFDGCEVKHKAPIVEVIKNLPYGALQLMRTIRSIEDKEIQDGAIRAATFVVELYVDRGKNAESIMPE